MSEIDDAVAALAARLATAFPENGLGEALAVVAVGRPRADPVHLIQAVRLTYGSTHEDAAREAARLVRATVEADVTIGGTCARSVVDPFSLNGVEAVIRVRLVIRRGGVS